MANAIPPPAQRLINCLANISPRTQSKVVAGIATGLFITFVGSVVTLGLGLAKKLSKPLQAPLTASLLCLIILLGIVLILLSFCDHYLPRPLRPQPALPPRLLRIPSIDSGLGSEISLVDSPLNGSREDLQGSHDSGINIV